jgi:hypothetical protein
MRGLGRKVEVVGIDKKNSGRGSVVGRRGNEDEWHRRREVGGGKGVFGE